MSTPIVLGNISSVMVDAGDAPEMELRVNQLLQAGGRSSFLADAVVTGVGVGPRWLTQLSIVNDPNLATLAALADLVAFVRRAGNPVALEAAIDEVLAANPAVNYIAIRVAGAGAGRDYLALILLLPLPIE